MSFFAIIPLWITSLFCYLTSEKQSITTKPMNKKLGVALLIAGYCLSSFLFSFDYAVASSLLASLVVLMLALVTHTILSTYSKRVFVHNALVVALLVIIGGINYVA